MPAHIIIEDGPPPYWWASTDIWVVPGSDPNGAPGSPVAGQPAYLWAHVANTGNVQANGTRVDFYWADPAGQIVAGVANPIGSAFVDLDTNPAGEDVLCLVPWVPVIVNGGHECLLAVAHGPNDSNPLPDPLPNGFPFDPPSHDQVAQVNVTVLAASMLRAAFLLSVHALPRRDKRVRLTAEYGGELSPLQLERLGLHALKLRPSPRLAVRARLSLEPLCGGDASRDGGKAQQDAEAEMAPDEQDGADESADEAQARQHGIELTVPRGGSAGVYVALSARRLDPGHYQLVHIVERSEDKVLGGVSYVVYQPASQTQDTQAGEDAS